MKPSLVAVGLILLFHTSVTGSARVEMAAPGEMVLQLRFDEEQFTFRHGQGYDYIEAHDMALFPDEGVPALPWKAVHVAIPWDRLVVRVEATRTEEITLTGHYQVVPTQPPAVLGTEAIRWVEGRPDIYSTDAFYPAEPVRNVTEGFLSENRVVSLAVCPFRWNPADGSLILAERIDVRIILTSDSHPRGLRRLRGGQAGSSRLARSLVANPSDLEGFAPAATSPVQALVSQLEQGYYEYVLITADSLTSSFEPLLEWKRQKGVPSKCVTREWIEANYTGNDSQDQIRNFIKDAYANWGTLWVVLGGDTAVVPSRQCVAMKIDPGPGIDKIDCDLYFADLDGTWNADGDPRYGEVTDSVDMYPDVVVGRASVETTSEAQVFVDKVLTYEKAPPSGYALDMLMAGEVMWRDPYTDAGVGLDIIDEDCIPQRFDPISKLYESLGNENRETVLAAMSAGQHFFFHDGHGSGHALYVGPSSEDVIESEDADTLTNGPRNFILHSIACVPAVIRSDCIAEHLVHSPGGGCVAFIGNSHVGWGCPGHPGYGYSDRFQYEFAKQVFVEEVVNLGLAHDLSKLPYVPFAGDKNVYRFCEYELLLIGDPEMPVWTHEPTALVVDYPDSIMASGDDLAVVVTGSTGAIEGARICLLNDDDVYLVMETDVSGRAVFDVATASPDSMLLTVTARNHLPLQTRIGVSPGGKRLAWSRCEVADENDGSANPGETIGLRLAVKNHGDETAYGVSATVRAMDTLCVVVDSTAVFGEVAPGLDIWAVDTLVIMLAGGLANGDVALLEIEIRDDAPQTWTSRLPIVVASPVVGVVSHGVREIAGDGDHIVEPGEDILLTLEIHNRGLTVAPGTQAFVTSIDPYLSVGDSLSLAGDIGPGDHSLSLHCVEISPMCPEVYIGVIEVDLWVSGVHSAKDTTYLSVGNLEFAEDCEAGEGGWIHTGTPDLWHLTSYRSHSGSYSWYFGGESSRRYPNDAEGTLTSESVLAGEASALSFWVWYEVSTYGVDGVFIVLFRNGVADTLDFIGSGGALAPTLWDTLITVSDWVEWKQTLDDVIPGDTLKVAFSFVSDSDTVAEGVYLDDIRLTAAAPEITGIEDKADQTARAQIVVTPNPAHDVVSMVAAPSEGRLTLDIYDTQGRLVAQVVRPPGRRSARWDLKNRQGKRVAPGVYLVRTSHVRHQHLAKIVVLR